MTVNKKQIPNDFVRSYQNFFHVTLGSSAVPSTHGISLIREPAGGDALLLVLVR